MGIRTKVLPLLPLLCLLEMQGADGGRMAVSASDSCDAIQTLLDINAMIDIHSKHLEGLRTQCSTSAELIQQEIRTIEAILVLLILFMSPKPQIFINNL